MKKKQPKINDAEARQFAAAYIASNGNASAAARALKPHLTPGSARQEAHKIMKCPEVQDAIVALRSEVTAKSILDLDRACKIVTEIATGNSTPMERLAACRQLGLWMGWEKKASDPTPPPKAENPLATFMARIRQAQHRPEIQDAEIISETTTKP